MHFLLKMILLQWWKKWWDWLVVNLGVFLEFISHHFSWGWGGGRIFQIFYYFWLFRKLIEQWSFFFKELRPFPFLYSPFLHFFICQPSIAFLYLHLSCACLPYLPLSLYMFLFFLSIFPYPSQPSLSLLYLFPKYPISYLSTYPFPLSTFPFPFFSSYPFPLLFFSHFPFIFPLFLFFFLSPFHSLFLEIK